MRNVETIRTLFAISLLFAALQFGCGGGGVFEPPPTSNQPPAPQASVGQGMQAPVLGFVYAEGGTEARAITGIPGGSSFSPPLTVPEGITGLVFPPGQNYALAEGAAGGTLGLIPLAGAVPGALVEIPGAMAKPDVIAFSPGGAAAAVYSASEGQLQVIAGLPKKPQLTRQMTSGDLPGAVRLLAIADDGVTLVAVTVNSSVYLLSSGGTELLENASDVAGIVFTPRSNNALIFDRGAGTLSLLQAPGGASATRVLAGGLTGIGGNVALGTDGLRAVIGSSSANQLWEIDLGSLAVQQIHAPATPAVLEPLRLPGHYLFAWQPGQPAWILNTNEPKGTVYFVPAAPEAQQAARSGL